jgi:hypothetical protein
MIWNVNRTKSWWYGNRLVCVRFHIIYHHLPTPTRVIICFPSLSLFIRNKQILWWSQKFRLVTLESADSDSVFRKVDLESQVSDFKNKTWTLQIESETPWTRLNVLQCLVFENAPQCPLMYFILYGYMLHLQKTTGHFFLTILNYISNVFVLVMMGKDISVCVSQSS